MLAGRLDNRFRCIADSAGGSAHPGKSSMNMRLGRRDHDGQRLAARQAYDGALSRNDGAAPCSVGRDRGRKPIAVGIAAAGDRYLWAGSKPDGTRMDGDGGGRGVAERARDGRSGLAVYRPRLGTHRMGRGPGDLAGRQLWIAAARSRRAAGQARGPRVPTGSGAVVPPPRGVGFAGIEDAFHRPRRVPARHGAGRSRNPS